VNTPAHLLVGAAAFACPGAWRVNLAAILGALAPDASLYLMAGTAIFLRDIPPQVVFDQYYFSPEWQQVFAIDNSFVIWGLVLLAAFALRSRWMIAFAGAALLHLALDFPLHHDDARRHFWPLTDWVFQSPVSYWDRSRHAGIVAPLEALLSLGLCVVLLRRFKGGWSRVTILAVGLLQLAPVLVWSVVFAG
jgi:hypothetical protein